MKKILSLALCVVMLTCSALTLVACGSKNASAENAGAEAASGTTNVADAKEIAVVTDVGQLMDGGFNQGTWEGSNNFANKNGLGAQYYQPANGADATDNDRIAAMRQAIQNGAKIIVTPGFLQATAIETVAKENPDVKFVFVDGWAMGLDNVTAIVYKEEESGYMAGYAVAKDGYTKLGGTFGGGGTNPACNRFGYGFVQGAADAAKELGNNIEMKYSYKYGDGFSASSELQAQISSWYADGTEVVFACGGSMFQSVKSAAEEISNGKIVGVDVDQSGLSDRVITSAVKGLAVSVEKILTEFYAGEWDAKLKNVASNLGAADDATGIPIATSKFNNFTSAEYDKLFNDIKSGTLKVRSDVPDDCNNEEWLKNAFADYSNVTIIFEK